MTRKLSSWRILSVMLALWCLPLLALAQQTVNGTVTSSKDQSPLEGVSVTIKGTTKGTFAYPWSEQTLNAASRTAAVSAQGWSEDTYNQKVWWDE